MCTPSRDCTTVPGVEPIARAHAHPNLRRCCEGGSRTFLGSDLVFREDTAGSLGGSGGKGTKWWQRTAPMHFTHRALRTILLHLLRSMAWSAVFPPSRPRSTAAFAPILPLPLQGPLSRHLYGLPTPLSLRRLRPTFVTLHMAAILLHLHVPQPRHLSYHAHYLPPAPPCRY